MCIGTACASGCIKTEEIKVAVVYDACVFQYPTSTGSFFIINSDVVIIFFFDFFGRKKMLAQCRTKLRSDRTLFTYTHQQTLQLPPHRTSPPTHHTDSYPIPTFSSTKLPSNRLHHEYTASFALPALNHVLRIVPQEGGALVRSPCCCQHRCHPRQSWVRTGRRLFDGSHVDVL